MPYYTGSIAAVPAANKDKYRAHATAMWPVFKTFGASGMVESWGVDVPKGTHTDFQGAVDAKEGEEIVFSWIAWPDKATADASWEKMQNDPIMQTVPEMPFDGSRMIFGGFVPVFGQGEAMSQGYVQGFTLAVPDANKAQYEEMAAQAWPMFQSRGALAMLEGWGEDVPRGKQTDFYRATKAEDGEVAVFSWVVWPDRATCDAASKAMEAEMEGQEMPPMPFDGKRMMWGGFEPIFHSAAA